MKRPLRVALLLSGITMFGHAKDDDSGTAETRPAGSAVEAAKAHVRSFLEGDLARLEKSYAAQVLLMPGHELLKDEYGLAGPKGRTEQVTVANAKLLQTMKKAFEGRRQIPPKAIDAVFESFGFTPLETKVGDNATAPPDPVDTPDGNLHFTIEDGDVLFKVGRKKGDFLLFQFRLIGGKWKVVAEYLD